MDRRIFGGMEVSGTVIFWQSPREQGWKQLRKRVWTRPDGTEFIFKKGTPEKLLVRQEVRDGEVLDLREKARLSL